MLWRCCGLFGEVVGDVALDGCSGVLPRVQVSEQHAWHLDPAEGTTASEKPAVQLRLVDERAPLWDGPRTQSPHSHVLR
jgi:hypothetical protein